MGRNPETWSAAESVGAVLPFLIFPSGVINDLVAGFGSGVAWDWGATGLVLYHLALWTGIAWLGLLRIEKRPLKLYAATAAGGGRRGPRPSSTR